MPAQPTLAKTDHPDVVKLLTDNIHNLEHPLGWIKHPYFQEQFTANQDGVREIKKRFCEALVLLLEKHDKLKPPPKKRAPRKAAPQ
ncbi:hypothetical protein [Mycobacterium intracellulare]|uniref:hypothetical protein n=1 Tax=Mycobacterium intracellulare TaxID=1767 RepID=UPI00109ED4D7|nr:hypothetical protein [Mycobacterium intracellulare]